MGARKPQVMIIDDEEGIREQLRDFIGRLSYSTEDFGNPLAGLDALRTSPPELLLLDIRMPQMDGLDLLKVLRREVPEVSVIMVSGHGTMDIAIEALRMGAVDFLQKPIDFKQLEATLERCCRNRHTPQTPPAQPKSGVMMIGESAPAQKVKQLLRMAAESPCQSLLITGETGTGKEVAANLFHEFRHGSRAPFVAENCPALPESLVESELFGHVKGAFTGATQDRKGAFERADGGTLFLDEVGDLTPTAQAKLLRVLEARRVRKVGSTKDSAVEVAVVAATNRSLAAEVKSGRFRQDLLFRLNTFAVHLPPLRDRIEDILPIARYFLEQFAGKMGRAAPGIGEDACQALCSYHYPGNARELRNMIERASIMSGGKDIRKQHLSFAFAGIESDFSSEAVSSFGEAEPEEGDDSAATRQALLQNGWNRRKAAKALGVSYDALRWRIRKYGLTDPDSAAG